MNKSQVVFTAGVVFLLAELAEMVSSAPEYQCVT
jgi:hypothetical protein